VIEDGRAVNGFQNGAWAGEVMVAVVVMSTVPLSHRCPLLRLGLQEAELGAGVVTAAYYVPETLGTNKTTK